MSGRLQPHRVGDDLVDQADHRRLLRQVLKLLDIRVAGRVGLDLGAVGDPLDAGPAALVPAGEGVGEVLLGRDHRGDRPAERHRHRPQGEAIAGIGHGQVAPPSVSASGRTRESLRNRTGSWSARTGASGKSPRPASGRPCRIDRPWA